MAAGIGFATMMSVEERLLKTKNKAMNKLQYGRTCSYTADELPELPVKALREHCTISRLSSKGSAAELRTRLAEHLLAERFRTDRYRESIAQGQAAEITGRVDRMLKRNELVEQTRSSTGPAPSTEQTQRTAALRDEVEKSVSTVEKRSAQREDIHRELDGWHQEFQPFQISDNHSSCDRVMRSEIPWATYSAQKFEVRSSAEQRFMGLSTDAVAYQQQFAGTRRSKPRPRRSRKHWSFCSSRPMRSLE
eukprot:SAG22_NODE_1618_length_3971_cov_2.707645_1_plen_249_part_00